ncbi:MAG: hypothetical protein PHV37_00420 [Candidatus Gastranaerophilales bacterium]|nr:hypothetical protein [Candidatus Gastranaerophilales bacterium]
MEIRTINEIKIPVDRLYTETTDICSLSDDSDSFSTLSTSAMLARGGVPSSHRRVADNYMIIKKVYGFPVVQSRINNKEQSLLAKYDFNPLEFSTIKQINEELSFLKKWSLSLDVDLRIDADEIIQVRAKELKFLVATRYTALTNEVYNGYMALEKYFEDISKYYRG